MSTFNFKSTDLIIMIFISNFNLSVMINLSLVMSFPEVDAVLLWFQQGNW